MVKGKEATKEFTETEGCLRAGWKGTRELVLNERIGKEDEKNVVLRWRRARGGDQAWCRVLQKRGGVREPASVK